MSEYQCPRQKKKHYKSWTPWTNSYWTDTIGCGCVCVCGFVLNPCPVLFLNQQSFVFTLHSLLAIRNSFIFILMTLPSQHNPFRIKNWKYRMQQIVTLWPVSGDSCPLWARNNNNNGTNLPCSSFEDWNLSACANLARTIHSFRPRLKPFPPIKEFRLLTQCLPRWVSQSEVWRN